MINSISILGSTGSIGLSTLKIIDNKKKDFKIYLLSANNNYELICKQIKKYKPKFFIINDKNTYIKIKKKFRKNEVKILNSFNNLKLNKKIEISVSAIPGLEGLKPTLEIIKFSKKILIANKESIICGWNLIKKSAKKNNTKIIPVDSEHFSIFNLLKNNNLNEIKKIYITASGGPFLNYKTNQFKNIKIKDALKHPKWKMGKKITIDSATLMNKIFELIEAQKLFDIPSNKIDIMIHPESLVHAIIFLKNGLTKLIYHETTMIIPLGNAIYNDNINIDDFIQTKKKFNDQKLKNLTFQEVNKKNFPAIQILDKIRLFPSAPIIINAANEILVEQFLKKKIPFLDIIKFIKSILNNRNFKKYAIRKPKNLNEIFKIDSWAKKLTLNKIF